MATHCERDETAEIEITPEMIEAGVRALVSYNPRLDLEEDGARRIFMAMIKAKYRPETMGAAAGSL